MMRISTSSPDYSSKERTYQKVSKGHENIGRIREKSSCMRIFIDREADR
jgi:hypothetical protein